MACSAEGDSVAKEDASNSSSKRLHMNAGSRWDYLWYKRRYLATDFLSPSKNDVRVSALTFRHASGVRVTLIPTLHFAHPQFFRQVDELCCQHTSVLMEGRYGNTGSPSSTVVPARPLHVVRPPEHEDDEGWEPSSREGFFQPYSWGVAASPSFTVVHAADAYDYEMLPYWAKMRFNVPFFGGYKREKHCMTEVLPLLASKGYDSFAVPWGAAHMPIMSQMLINNGFYQVSETRLLVFLASDGLVSSSWCRKLHGARRSFRLLGQGSYFAAAALVAALFQHYCASTHTEPVFEWNQLEDKQKSSFFR